MSIDPTPELNRIAQRRARDQRTALIMIGLVAITNLVFITAGVFVDRGYFAFPVVPGGLIGIVFTITGLFHAATRCPKRWRIAVMFSPFLAGILIVVDLVPGFELTIRGSPIERGALIATSLWSVLGGAVFVGALGWIGLLIESVRDSGQQSP